MKFGNVRKIRGELELPGDKSISHRAVLFSALAKGTSVIRNLSKAEDVRSSLKCVTALGINYEITETECIIKSPGLDGLHQSKSFLDAGNSGTTARLLAGILATRLFASEIRGDESLSARPMRRIIEPLSQFGCKVEANNGDKLPLKIYPSDTLHPISYSLPVASAQIKSAVLLAGLAFDEETTVIENFQSRDHTERMLGMKHKMSGVNRIIYSSRKNIPEPQEYYIPGDISSAAFFVVAALLIPDSFLRIKNVTLNPTRTGYLDHLKKMGGDIAIINEKISSNEIYGDIVIRGSHLTNVPIPPEMIPNIIDEIPILAVAGCLADGVFEVRHAQELRVKETDRINALMYNLKLAAAVTEEFNDGFRIVEKGNTANPRFDSFHDHRIAMAFAVYSLVLEDGGKIDNFDCVKISNPDFVQQLQAITG